MSDLESTVRSLFDAANTHDLDQFFTHVADDVKFVNPITGTTDRAGMRGFHDAFFGAFPISITASTASSPRARARWPNVW